MLQFIPATDELMESPDLPGHWRLVPYQVDHPCFRWSLCDSVQPDTPAGRPTRLNCPASAAESRRDAPRGAQPHRR